MTLWFVGTGVSGAASLSAAGREAISGAAAVYVEQFTSPWPAGAEDEVARLAGAGRVVRAKRWMIEDGAEILRRAESGEDVAVVSYGDPYAATTHTELRVRAARAGVRTRTAHAASALTAIVGECGLHHYKVGRIATVMRSAAGAGEGAFGEPAAGAAAAASTYRLLRANIQEGCHTILLLEYDEDGGGFFMGPRQAMDMLEEADRGQQWRGAFDGSTYVAVASRVGLPGQAVAAGRVGSVRGMDFGSPPHAIVVPGSLHFTEADALAALAECADPPEGNSERLASVPRRMVEKYVPAVRESVRSIAPACAGVPRHGEILDSAGRYLDDACHFLEAGDGEVAVLCAGYADGLVDALRMAAGLDPGAGAGAGAPTCGGGGGGGRCGQEVDAGRS